MSLLVCIDGIVHIDRGSLPVGELPNPFDLCGVSFGLWASVVDLLIPNKDCRVDIAVD